MPVGGRPGPEPAPHRRGVDAAARSRRSWPTRGTPAGRCGTGSAPTSTWSTRPTPASGTSRCSGGTCPRAGSSPASPRTRRWSARPTSSPPRTPAPPRGPARGRGRAAPVPAGRAAGLRAVRAAAGISLVQRQARLPVPPRPHQRHPRRTRPGRRTPTSARTRSCRTWPPCTCCSPARPRRAGGAAPAAEPTSGPHASPGEVIGYLREHEITLTYDPAAGDPAGGRHRDRQDHHRESKLTPAAKPGSGRRRKKERRSPGAGGSPRPGDDPACPETGGYGEFTVSEERTHQKANMEQCS